MREDVASKRSPAVEHQQALARAGEPEKLVTAAGRHFDACRAAWNYQRSSPQEWWFEQ